VSLLSLGAVTVAGYRLHTGDQTNASAVSGRLLEAEDLLDEELRRHLALAERTETFKMYPDGRVYPDAYPIVSSDLTIDGRALRGATTTSDVATFVAYWPDYCPPATAEVTWTGGYDADTLPVTLRHALYELAAALAAPRPVAVPVGATSASVGDVSVSFADGSDTGIDAFVPGLSDRVCRYRNRWV
jgi:hypothetical protein